MLMKKSFSVHFIGVCGAGMSILAKYLKYSGFIVSGSDIIKNEIYSELISCGINVFIGHNKQNVQNADIVVVSSSIKEDNVEYLEALRLEKAIYKRAQLLGLITSTIKNSIGIAGTHGKTTSTAMATHILKRSLINFTSFIGGNDLLYNNFVYNDDSKFLVSEVCEYDRNIKHVSPYVSVVLNIDNDHLDCYKGVLDLKNEFYEYLSRSKYKIVCFDDKSLKEYNSNNVISFAINEEADYKAENIKNEDGKYSFTVKLKNGNNIQIKLNVLGKHNIYNALSNIALFDGVFNFDENVIKSGIESFVGVKRRFEYLGKLNDFNIYADYCHHPTEIKETLKVYKEFLKGDYKVIFQPHTFSRTEILFSDFVHVLKNENILIFSTYPAREKYNYKGSAKRLAKSLKCKYIKNEIKLKNTLKKRKFTKNYIILGAGDLYDIMTNFIKCGLK